jgi:hypothetical protein
MRRVRVDFVKANAPHVKHCQAILVEDDVDKYEIMTHFESATLEFGWVITSIEDIGMIARIERI